MRLVNLEDQKDRSQICGSLSNPRILFSVWFVTPKTEFKIRRSAYASLWRDKFSQITQIGRRDMGNLVGSFPIQRLNHGFGSNPLNLCNLRNLWIFNLRDLG